MRRAVQRLTIVLVLLGCDPVRMPDASVELDGASGEPEVRIGLEVREGDGPPDWQLRSALVQLASVRAENDRGGALEPTWSDVGRVRIDEDPPTTLLPAVPATYGGLTLTSGASGSTFELTFGADENEVEVISARAYEIMARCESGGATLGPFETLELRAELDATPIAEVLAAATLPEPQDGRVRVDAASAPAVLAEVESAFDAAWLSTCGDD